MGLKALVRHDFSMQTFERERLVMTTYHVDDDIGEHWLILDFIELRHDAADRHVASVHAR